MTNINTPGSVTWHESYLMDPSNNRRTAAEVVAEIERDPSAVHIRVTAPVALGKTTIAGEFAQWLATRGFKVDVYDTDGPEYPCVDPQYREDRIAAIASRVPVTLTTIQTRNPLHARAPEWELMQIRAELRRIDAAVTRLGSDLYREVQISRAEL